MAQEKQDKAPEQDQIATEATQAQQPAAAGAAAPAKAPAAAGGKKVRRSVARGIAFVRATFNNTIVTITDNNGDVLATASAGMCGFKGSRKSTPYAASQAGEQAAGKARKMGLTEVEVKVKGPGSGRESAITALQAAGLKVLSIEDITPIPHNGCRPRKRRRV
jgi:small subunit ribosomal protein S11